jgi:hypothetical protein
MQIPSGQEKILCFLTAMTMPPRAIPTRLEKHRKSLIYIDIQKQAMPHKTHV